MGFWKKLDDKIVNYLKKQIEKQDEKAEKFKKNNEKFLKEQEKEKKEKADFDFIKKIDDIGLYFMDLYDKYKKSSNKNEKNRELILNYYYMLGCASQGRIDEVNEIIEENKRNYPMYNKIFIKHTPKILRMSEISKKIDDKSTYIDMKNGESIGEYMNRQLLKRKTFIREFMFFVNTDIENLFK